MTWKPSSITYLPSQKNRSIPKCQVAFSYSNPLNTFFTKSPLHHVTTRTKCAEGAMRVTWMTGHSRHAQLMKASNTNLGSVDGLSSTGPTEGGTVPSVPSQEPSATDSATPPKAPPNGMPTDSEPPTISNPPLKNPVSQRLPKPDRPHPRVSVPSEPPVAEKQKEHPFSGREDFDWPTSNYTASKKPRAPPGKRTAATIEAGLRKKRAAEIKELQEQMETNPVDAGDGKEVDPSESVTENAAPFSLSERLRQEGHIAEANGEHSLASQLYWRSSQLDGQNGKAWQNLAKSEGRRKRSMRASAAILKRALVQNPRNAYLWQSLGFLLFRMRQYEDARSHFQTGITRDPNHAPLYSTWAHLEFALKNYSRARQLYETGSKIADGGARVYHNWGQMELKLGNEVRARELFDAGLVLEPFNAYIWETLGSLAKKEDDHERARECYLNALRSEENNVVVLEAWAKLEVVIGNFDKAREIFDRGVKADIRDSRILHSWSLFEYQGNNFVRAKELIEKAVLMCPNDSFLWTHFARIEASLEDYPRARAMFNRACEINSKDWRAWDAWSAMEHSLGNFEQAEKLLRESFRIRFDVKGDFTILANMISDRFS